MRLRLGIDLDGVVADFNAGWISRYNAEFGTDLRPENVTTWGAPKSLTHFGTMAKFWKWAATSGEGHSIFRVLDPYPGAITALERLARLHSIVIVTTKPNFAIDDTYAWLDQHRVPHDELHITNDKADVACDVYLDDADHNLLAIRDVRPQSAVVRFVRPWNRPHHGVHDVTSFEEFEALVGTL